MTVAPTTYGAVTDEVIAELKTLLGDENVLTEMHERAMRASTARRSRCIAGPTRRPTWSCCRAAPTTSSAILKLANEKRIPVTPRAGASGLADGAMPLRKGICVDIKRMNEIFEIDEDNMCVTVGTGINMLKLNEVLEPLGKIYPDDLAGYANAMLGGRIGCGGWTLSAAASATSPTPSSAWSACCPTARSSGSATAAPRRSARAPPGYRLKDLFMQHQGTLCIVTEGRLELYPKPEVEFAGYFAFDNWDDAYNALYDVTTHGLRHPRGGDDLRRQEDRLPAPRRRGLHPAAEGCQVRRPDGHSTARKCEVEPAVKEGFEIGKKWGGKYLGHEQGEGDWASRHDRYHLSLPRPHARRPGDAHVAGTARTRPPITGAARRPREVARDRRQVHGASTPACSTTGACSSTPATRSRAGATTSPRSTSASRSCSTTTRPGTRWIRMKKEIATRRSTTDVLDLHLPRLLPRGRRRRRHAPRDGDGSFDVMKKIKRMIDPNNIMNPGKYCLDEAYED